MLTESRKLTREVFGLFLLFWAMLIFLSLVTHSPADPSLNHVVSSAVPVQNNAGLLGAYISGFLNDVFGIAAYVWPLVVGAVGAACLSPAYELLWWRWLGYFFLTICFLSVGAALDIQLGDIRGGGMIGNAIYARTERLLSPGGSALLWLFVLVIALELAFGISWLKMFKKIHIFFRGSVAEVAKPHPPLALPWPLSVKGWREKMSSSPRKALPEVCLESKTVDVTPQKPPLETDRAASAPIVLEPHIMPDLVSETEATSDTKPVSQETQDAHSTADTKAQLTQDAAPHADTVARAPDTQRPQEQDVQGLTSPTTEEHAPFAEKDCAKEDCVQEDATEEDGTQENCAEKDSAEAEKSLIDAQLIPQPLSQQLEPCDDFFATAEPPPPPLIPLTTPPVDTQDMPHVHPDVHPDTHEDAPSPQKPQAQSSWVPLPSMELLKRGNANSHDDGGEREARGKALMACLSDFNIQGELVRITPGPVVTMYEVRPAAGIRVARFSSLSDDIALALKAIAVRIQAPIPGSDTVGIEIPNKQRHMVNFREILESSAFENAAGPLPMALGKDISGKPYVADLARMPHLLVAGATGAGKSVGLNSILLSLLYTTYPEHMQLLLIDPKRIELAVYADLPHLVHPVVTEMQFAKNALDWAVHEMDKRYAAMARLSVRNIMGFNDKIKAYGDNLPSDLSDLQPMSYLVIVIDELADLMLTAAREVETSIVRLAQLARAAGIHMILATQRPSVNVVTGIIKANFPCRISFQVTSAHDSRTILDLVGAERLLGKGDMLFKPSGDRPLRLHGPFVPDEEVHAVVEHWKKYLPPAYKVDFAQWGADDAVRNTGTNATDDNRDDALYGEVRAFVEESGKASTSLVQRRFKIGFVRAARLMDQLEMDGIIGPADGSKARTVIGR